MNEKLLAESREKKTLKMDTEKKIGNNGNMANFFRNCDESAHNICTLVLSAGPTQTMHKVLKRAGKNSKGPTSGHHL